jgi:hypothetical protein
MSLTMGADDDFMAAVEYAREPSDWLSREVEDLHS